MSDPCDTRPVGPDSSDEAPTLAPEGTARVTGPVAEVPPSDSGATVGPSGADATALYPGAGPAPESPRPDPLPGGLAQYHRRNPVGTWSHGRIEEAEHSRLATRVLLRILDADAARDPAVRGAFLRIARAVALLDHPNLAAGVLEADGDGPEPYVAFSTSDDRPLEGLGPRRDWLRSRDGLPYDNRRLALLITDAARGLQALHQTGLIHGTLRPTSLRLSARSGRLRLHDLPSMPLMMESPDDGPPGRELADLAAAVAVLVTGREAPPRGPRAGPIARALRRANPGLDPELARLLGRCLANELPDRLDREDELIARSEPCTRRRVILAGWRDRGFTMLYDGFVALIASSALASALVGVPWYQNSRLLAFLAVLCLISSLCELAVGWSLGRRTRGLRLVDVSGARASRLRILLRAMLKLGWVAAAVAVYFGIRGLLDRAGLTGWPWRVPAFLAGLAVLASSVRTRSRRPVHDVLTGVTWGIRERVDRPTGLDSATTIRPVRARSETVGAATGAGERVGPNRIERELGRGGMGAVYAAWDEVLDRPVAVKLITEARDASPDFLDRFEKEARLAAQVRHENVAQVFGVGQDRHRPYMVLELLHGRTLQQRVEERGPLPVGEAWSYIGQAAAGLGAANRLGIVHRDIKPSNLMLTDDGVIKVLDFGISKLVVEDDPPTDADLAAEADRIRSDPAWLDAHLTRTGALLGTPLYMSPEQVDGRRLDCRSDIYALGMTLYYLLAGRPPFEGRDVVELLRMQRQARPPSLERSVVNLTPDRAEVLERMIAKDPAERFADYEELQDALRATAPRPAERAAIEPRVVASLLDMLIFAIPSLLVEQLTLPGLMGRAIGLVATNLGVIVPVVSVWLWGFTPGQRLVGLRVTRTDGGRVGLARSLLRQFIFSPASFSALVVPSLQILGRAEWLVALTFVERAVSLVLMKLPRRQAVHDRVADTIVVKVPRGSSRRRGPRGPGDRIGRGEKTPTGLLSRILPPWKKDGGSAVSRVF